MIKGFHHAAISTPDLDRCIAFYTGIIGGAVAWEFGWDQGTAEADAVTGLQNSACKAAMLKIGESFLEVFEFSSPHQDGRDTLRAVNLHGITHICLEVTDIDGEYRRLKEAGMDFHCTPMAQDGSSMVYGRDPDGNVVELIEFTG
jgi:glyoxylase I family protein